MKFALISVALALAIVLLTSLDILSATQQAPVPIQPYDPYVR
ncbi:hypothetical protein [Neoroseomonas terrae]|nr:hypothetical protein [Neoroseomonas terrae]